MKPLPHHYEVRLTGGQAGYAQVSSAGLPGLDTAPPAEFGGPGDAWSPEHLLLASVQTCFLFTLRAVARASAFQFSALAVEARGTVAREGGVARFTEILLRPKLLVPPGTDHSQAQRILEKSERACLVTASLSTPVYLDAEIVEEAQPVIG